MALADYIVHSPRLVTRLAAAPFAPYRGAVIRELDADVERVLEAGIGRGNFLRALHARRPRARLTGFDIFPGYVANAARSALPADLAVADVRALPFADNAFDAALCIEVIEHMTIDQGAQVMAELERVARRQVIISTTSIPLEHELIHGDHPADGNAHMVHQSEWTPGDFERAGYTVHGMYPKGPLVALDPVYYASYVLPLQRLVYNRPSWARAWVATKRLHKS